MNGCDLLWGWLWVHFALALMVYAFGYFKDEE